MKEKYENMTCEVIEFDSPDVITTSGGGNVSGGGENTNP